MKAKIRSTGEIIDVEHVCNPDDPSDYAFYEKITDGYPPAKYYSPMELDFGSCGHSKEIDWEQRRYEIAKAALIGIISAPIIPGVCPYHIPDNDAAFAVHYADELIKELKGE